MTDPLHRSPHDEDRYAIRVCGHLDPRWTDRLDGMTLTRHDDGTTVIEGTIADQAALHGLLRTLRDLGLTLISLSHTDNVTHPDDDVPASRTAQGE